MGKYDDLKSLEELRERGAISEEEYKNEKSKILNSPERKSLWGIEENQFLMFMHLGQFVGLIIPIAGYILPIAMWLSFKDENKKVDQHGKNITNFIISWLIYYAISSMLILIFIGTVFIAVLGIANIVFIIIASIKANNKEYWKYPLSIQFFK